MIRDKTTFRPAEADDRAAIASVITRAFGRETEAALVDALLDGDDTVFSWVAVLDGQIIGHVLFSQLDGPEKSLALGPLSVDPDRREMLIGTELVRRAMLELRGMGWKSVFVVGDPAYYTRFGFKQELAEAITSQYQGPYLQAMELQDGALSGYDGAIGFPKPFSELAP